MCNLLLGSKNEHSFGVVIWPLCGEVRKSTKDFEENSWSVFRVSTRTISRILVVRVVVISSMSFCSRHKYFPLGSK
jgi:hypothetical protein